MSQLTGEEIKRWTARRKSALVVDILQAETTSAGASRKFGELPAIIEKGINQGKLGMENALRTRPEDLRERAPAQGSARGLRLSHPGAARQKKIAVPAANRRVMIDSSQQRLQAEGVHVSLSQLCRWFNVPRRSLYYRPTKTKSKVRPKVAKPIKELIEPEPSFGYRLVAAQFGMNKVTVQRVFKSTTGRFANTRSRHAPAFRLFLRWQRKPARARRRICAGSGAAETDG